MPVKVDVIRDRANVVYDADEPVVENVYRLQIMNTDEVAARVHHRRLGTGRHEARLRAATDPPGRAPATGWCRCACKWSTRQPKPGSNRIEFTIQAVRAGKPDAQPLVIREKATFVVHQAQGRQSMNELEHALDGRPLVSRTLAVDPDVRSGGGGGRRSW